MADCHTVIAADRVSRLEAAAVALSAPLLEAMACYAELDRPVGREPELTRPLVRIGNNLNQICPAGPRPVTQAPQSSRPSLAFIGTPLRNRGPDSSSNGRPRTSEGLAYPTNLTWLGRPAGGGLDRDRPRRGVWDRPGPVHEGEAGTGCGGSSGDACRSQSNLLIRPSDLRGFDVEPSTFVDRGDRFLWRCQADCFSDVVRDPSTSLFTFFGQLGHELVPVLVTLEPFPLRPRIFAVFRSERP